MNYLNISCLFSSSLRDVSKSLSKPAGLLQNPIINISFRSNSDADGAGGGRPFAILRNRRTRYSRDLTVNVQG